MGNSSQQPLRADQTTDPRRVFVVHGRDTKARDAMFSFLRSLDLNPIEWSEAVSFTGEGSPFIGQVLDKAFLEAQAVVVLITGDDLARLGTRYQDGHDPPYEKDFTPQPRPNVLFEAGMAMGRHPERTILVSLGYSRPFSDVAGRNEVRISNKAEARQSLANRLRTVGCAVNTENRSSWLSEGDFDIAATSPDIPDKGDPLKAEVGQSLPAAQRTDTAEDEEVRVFQEVQRMLQRSQANTWTPALGSEEDQVAERLVKRGWLAPGPMGGYMILRRL